MTLNAYDGVENNYYVLVSRYLFELRSELDEVDTRVLFWLLRRHRGHVKRRRFEHAWEFTVRLDNLAGPEALGLSRGTTRRAAVRDRLLRSLEKLRRLGPVADLRHGLGEVRLTLSPAFFHAEADR